MAALLPDFEYDIFISYRHNDEKWMADFLPRLQDELRTLIEKPLRIYYDRSITDGLGATHQVRASLDHRVQNSMILVPLVSATYCDTDMYSWNYEFLPFLEHAKTNHLGLNLRLLNGYESSRVVPVRIHNLGPKHSLLLEKTLGGFLRSVDFVYEAEGGVNRPLWARDETLVPRSANGLVYTNQINRVANAIKELVEAAASQDALRNAAVAPAVPGAGAVAALGAAVAPQPAAPATTAPAPTGPVVFLAWTASKLKARREELALVCTKAGLRVVPTTDCPSDEEEFRRKTLEGLAAADCSLHLLGNGFGQRFEDESATSFPLYAYKEARRQADERPGFQQFVWYSPDETATVDKDQQDFVAQIRNELTAQCTFSSAPDAPQLVMELRTALTPPAPPPAPVEDKTGICFVYNALDYEEANAITDRLSEEFSLMVDTLAIEPDSQESYKEKTVFAVPKSKLAVVYFKHSADWALPFVKQLYQLVGGAASPTPILLVGEDDPAQNRLQSFKAPKVFSRIQPHLGVSEEVQRVFQKVSNPPA